MKIVHLLKAYPVALAAVLLLPMAVYAESLEDQELDGITASGEPTIVMGGSNSTITFASDTEIAQTIAPTSQAGLRALVLNNVAGENQVANGLNIHTASTGGQNNTLTQSWGSTNETTAVVVPATTAAADVVCNGALICKGTPAVAVVPGTIRALGSTADQIVTGGPNSSIVYAPLTNIVMKIESNSQTNMVALVVNNVTGLNQVGNAVNVQGNGVNLTDSGIAISGGNAGAGGGQHNVISQYRGTPANFSR